MSLDEIGLGDKTKRKKDDPKLVEMETPPSMSRLDLKQKELDHHFEVAEGKRQMGLPLSAKDQHALKSKQVVTGLQMELQQEQQKQKRTFVGRKGKVEPE